ncbi:hypothetical protein DV515_00011873 [Chloebia gouldiae]|uniref:phosphatidylinositol-3,4-bisphosphate 4-phosphatase n=1 Tax=Chloebia gouldiae TaxID=44316 RepID=A0A3L8S6D4_CHLGU|nr:hypothetical protein DV515_00011873 [Chloebia gouldiae]
METTRKGILNSSLTQLGLLAAPTDRPFHNPSHRLSSIIIVLILLLLIFSLFPGSPMRFNARDLTLAWFFVVWVGSRDENFASLTIIFVSQGFQSGKPDLYPESASKPDCESWAVALGEVNSEGLQNKIQQLRRLIMEIKEERSSDEARQFFPSSQLDSLGEPQFTSIQRIANEPKLEFSLACKDLVAATRDRKLNTFIQVSVVHPAEHILTRYSSTEIVEGTKDPLFLTGVTFPPEYPIYEETKIKLTVYDVKDKSQDTVFGSKIFSLVSLLVIWENRVCKYTAKKVCTSVLPDHKEQRADVGRSFLGCATFRVGDLVKSKDQQLTLTLRTSDGGRTVGTIEVNLVKMGELEEGETDHIRADAQDQKCALFRECTATEGISGKDNLPPLNAVLRNPVCKLYRFPTSDNKWMRVQEQMAETTLSFHVPKELINLHIKEDMRRCRADKMTDTALCKNLDLGLERLE